MPIFSAGSASVQIVPDFSGAQKTIGEWFARQGDLHVNVKPDLSQADLARAKVELDSLRGDATVDVSVDRNKLRNDITAGIRDAATSLSGLNILGDLVNASVVPAMIATAVGGLTELIAVVQSALGVLALAPAGILALAAPLAVIKLGTENMGAAFKAAASGSAAQLQEALNKLTPSARNFVEQVLTLQPAFKAMQLDVQEHLFVGLGDSIASLGRVALPILRTGLSGVATDLNIGLKSTMTVLQGLGPEFTTIFGNIVVAGRTMSGVMAPLIDAFVRMGAVGSAFLPQIAGYFLQAAVAADNWVKKAQATGQLTVIIQGALTVLQELVRLLLNVGSVLEGILSAALPFGQLLLGLLVQLTGQLAAFVHSAAGQTALTSFFSDVNRVASTLLPVIAQLAQAIVQFLLPGIGALAAALAPVIAQLGTQLISVLRAVSAMFPPLSAVVAGLVSALAPVIPAIGALITTLLPPLLTIFAQLTPIISNLTQIVGQGLVAAVRALAPALAPIGSAFVQILAAIEPLLPALINLAVGLLPPLLRVVLALLPGLVSFTQIVASLAGTLISLLGPALTAVVNVLSAVLVPVIRILGPLLPAIVAGFLAWGAAQKALEIIQAAWALATFIPFLIQYVAQVSLIEIATKAWTVAQAALDVVLNANPIGLVVLAIAALVAIVVLVVTHLQFFKTAAIDAWSGIQTAASAAWNTVLKPVFDALQTAALFLWHNVFQPMAAGIAAAWSVMATALQTVWVSVIQPVWSAMETVGKVLLAVLAVAVFGPIWVAWQVMSTAIRTAWTSIIQPTWAALQTAALFMYNSVLLPTWHAIQTAWTALGTAIRTIYTSIIVPTWAALQTAALFMYNSVLLPTWHAVQAAWNVLATAIRTIYQSIILPVWTALQTAALFMYNSVLLPTWHAIQAAWTALATVISTIYHSVIEVVWNTFATALHTLQSVFSTVVSGIQSAWNALVGVVETPVRFVVNTVIDGLINGVDDVMSFLHLPWHINPIRLPFADGGYTGDGPKYQVAGTVHAGEFVFTKEQTAAAGADSLYALAAMFDRNGGYHKGGLVADPGGLPGYATGGLVGEIATLITNPAQALKDLVTSFGSGGNSGPLWDMFVAMPLNMAEQMAGWLGAQVKAGLAALAKSAWSSFTSLLGGAAGSIAALLGIAPPMTGAIGGAKGGAFTGTVGGGAMQWKALVDQVLAQLGVPLSADLGVLNIIANESGGNPNAINLWDSNALAGHPSQGLMQTIPGTFYAYAGPYASRGITDPLANIYAGVNYALHTYGVGFLSAGGNRSATGGYLGYDTGGWLPPGASTVYNGTGSNELVLNPGQQGRLAQMLGVGAAGRGNGPSPQPVWQFYLGNREITELVDARVTYWSGADSRNIRSSQ